MVVTEPATERVPSDATNLLGGVADVLQAKRTNADLAQLGELAGCALYANDAQIREVAYRVEHGHTPGYVVRVWVLGAGD